MGWGYDERLFGGRQKKSWFSESDLGSRVDSEFRLVHRCKRCLWDADKG